jgi:acetoin utilization deacetylase AcuC-like enzyme
VIPTLYSDDFLTDYPTVDCECPERVYEVVPRISDIVEFIEPEPCSVDDLSLCHSDTIIKLVQKNSKIYDVALKAAGGAIRAAEIGLERPAFALIRPPGHHAGFSFNGGFCFFNNMAIAIKRLLSRGRIKNALIVDIDLHYGNGTEDIVNDDSHIAFRNIDTSRREDFLTDLEGALKDAGNFDIVGCSAGFDTYILDWGSILLTDDFEIIGKMLVKANPRFFAILEGGYYIPDLGKNVRAFLRGMIESCQ